MDTQTINLRNVPKELVKRAKVYAVEGGQSMKDLILDLLDAYVRDQDEIVKSEEKWGVGKSRFNREERPPAVEPRPASDRGRRQGGRVPIGGVKTEEASPFAEDRPAPAKPSMHAENAERMARLNAAKYEKGKTHVAK